MTTNTGAIRWRLSGRRLGRAALVTATAAATAVALMTPGAALAASGASAPHSATSATRLTFGIEPAGASGPDGRPLFSWGVTPGGSIRDDVAILNYSTRPIPLTVYATDAVETQNGGYGLLTGDQTPVGVGSWVSFGHPHVAVTVPARTSVSSAPGQVVLPLTLRVPRSASPGDHIGGVVAVLTSETRDSSGAVVRLEQRVATRIYLRVAGVTRARLTVADVRAAYSSTFNPFGRGTATVSYVVRNTGNVQLGATQLVQVSGPFGFTQEVRTAPALSLLLPGSSVRVSVQVPSVLPLVRLDAQVSVRPVVPVGQADPGLVAVDTGSTGFWGMPWVLILIAALLVSFFARRRVIRRRVARRKSGGSAQSRALTRSTVLIVAAAALGVPFVLGVQPARADSPPYNDPAVTGTLQLCGSNGKPITSGSVHDKPFVWRAVSTSAAPKPYNDPGRTATLFGYQPRQKVLPAQWSGELITASARYTNPAHPMAASTVLDEPLSGFLADYPTQWNGLVQLRLYLGVPEQPAFTMHYAAVDVQVTGSTWHVLETVPTNLCGTGQAISLEALLPGSSATPTPSGHSTSASTPTTSPASASASTPGAAAASALAGPTSNQPVSDGTSGRTGAELVALVVVLAVGGGAWWWLGGRRSHR